MSTKITPTVGRVVLVFFAAGTNLPGYALPSDPATPIPGLITYVHSESCISIAAFDVSGVSLPLISVQLLQEGDERPDRSCWAEWMPYQIGQAKKAEDREHDAKQLAVAESRASESAGMRAHALDMALRTPGLCSHHDVLKAAAAYQEHIAGKAAPSARELALEELLRSACAIADRKGADTAWDRFVASIHAVGLNGVTARTYRILPSDEQ
jgi:hypothetical protein